MKKTVRILCAILVLSMIMVVPAQAASVPESRGSAFFAAYGTDLYKLSSTSFEIWFDVDANATMMYELGASLIEVYRSSDQQNWTKVKTFEKADYPNMTDTYTMSYIDYVIYDEAVSGYYYTALITFYARNGSGFAEREVYTEVIRM